MSTAGIGDTITWLRNNKPVTGTVIRVEPHSYMVVLDNEPDRGEEWSIPAYRVLKIKNWMKDLCQV